MGLTMDSRRLDVTARGERPKCIKHDLAMTEDGLCALCRREAAEQAKLQIAAPKPPERWLGAILLSLATLVALGTAVAILAHDAPAS